MPVRYGLIWTPGALEDLARLREFIARHNPRAASHAARRIIDGASLLRGQPLLGRPLADLPEFHELLIPFGRRGYVLRYRVEATRIVILRIWHGLEDREDIDVQSAPFLPGLTLHRQCPAAPAGRKPHAAPKFPPGPL